MHHLTSLTTSTFPQIAIVLLLPTLSNIFHIIFCITHSPGLSEFLKVRILHIKFLPTLNKRNTHDRVNKLIQPIMVGASSDNTCSPQSRCRGWCQYRRTTINVHCLQHSSDTQVCRGIDRGACNTIASWTVLFQLLTYYTPVPSPSAWGGSDPPDPDFSASSSS